MTQPRLVMYFEVEAHLLAATPLLPDILQLMANDELPPGYKLGTRTVGDSDQPNLKVVCWDVQQAD